jgi:hypothetical protein
MSALSGITGADASGDRKPWLESGRYRVRITACREVTSRKNDVFFIVEVEVLVIHQTDVPEKMKVGRHYCQMIKFNDDMGPINVKRFLLCALGMDPNTAENQDRVDDDAAIYSVSNDQPLAGLEMEVHVEMITTKAGNPFSKHNWMPCEQWANAAQAQAAPAAPPQFAPQPVAQPQYVPPVVQPQQPPVAQPQYVPPVVQPQPPQYVPQPTAQPQYVPQPQPPQYVPQPTAQPQGAPLPPGYVPPTQQ